MKILLVINDTRGRSGWDRYAGTLIRALQEGGHDARTLGDILEGQGVSRRLHDATSYCTLKNPAPFDAPLLRRAIKAYDPDVIHFVIEPYLALLPFVQRGRARVIATIHGTYAYPPALTSGVTHVALRAIFAGAFARVDRIIAVSAYTRSRFIECTRHDRLDIPDERIIVIPNGIEVAHYAPAPRERGTGTILTVAAMKARKGLLETVRALAELRRRGVSFTWRIIGAVDRDEPYTREVLSEIRAHHLDESVVFVGSISEEELVREYQQADVFVLLPVERGHKVEGFGLVYLEASACGTPVVGAKGSGAEEAIQDGVSGFLVDPNDPAAVADAIERVRAGEIDPTRMRGWVESHDLSVVARAVIGVYTSRISDPL